MYSSFGEKFTRHAGITQLMDDLDEGLRAGDDMLMLGGGNPANIEALHALFTTKLQQALDDKSLLNALCNYDKPQGNLDFIHTLAHYLREKYDWPIQAENIALTNGSQSAFFYLFNLFSGEHHKKVLFPLSPEYIGYEDSGLSDSQFIGLKPRIELQEARRFKYHIDFDALELNEEIGLICLSRPTNPSGNVIDDKELSKLNALATLHQIPLLIDGAYGLPFPDLVFTKASAQWNDNNILCLSLSKLGLPGSRCGIVIAKPEIIQALSNLSGIINLAPGGVGATLAKSMLEDGSLDMATQEIIKPFYLARAHTAIALLQKAIPSPHFRIHQCEGAMFLWLWFNHEAIDDKKLYKELKARGLLVVPGSYFFPGVDKTWAHTKQCIRLNFAQSDEVLHAAVAILAEVINPLLSE